MLNPDYRDMLSAFADAGVEYLVIGAYALAAHGHPRATGDMELWVRRSPENVERNLRALSAFGAPLSEVENEGFAGYSLSDWRLPATDRHLRPSRALISRRRGLSGWRLRSKR